MDIVLTYGEAGQNVLAASLLHAGRFPYRHTSSYSTFTAVVQRRNLRSSRGRDEGPGRPRRILAVEEQVLKIVKENPRNKASCPTCTWSIAGNDVALTTRGLCNSLSCLACSSIVTSGLSIACYILWTKCRKSPIYSWLVINEALFTRNGMHNIHTTHAWEFVYMHAVHGDHFQHPIWMFGQEL